MGRAGRICRATSSGIGRVRGRNPDRGQITEIGGESAGRNPKKGGSLSVRKTLMIQRILEGLAPEISNFPVTKIYFSPFERLIGPFVICLQVLTEIRHNNKGKMGNPHLKNSSNAPHKSTGKKL